MTKKCIKLCLIGTHYIRLSSKKDNLSQFDNIRGMKLGKVNFKLNGEVYPGENKTSVRFKQEKCK